MVFVLLVGGALGWIAYSARVQRDAVAAIEAAGGSVWYQWQWRNGKPILNSRPPWPEWMVNLAGVDYFGGVVRVSLAQVGGDAELVSAARLGTLRELILDSSRVTDVGLAELGHLSQLQELSLMETRVTDAGLLHLKDLTDLKTLDLGDTRIAGAGLVHLVGLMRIERLVVRNTPMTDASVGNLARLTGLQDLDLAGTRLTEKGGTELQQSLPNLLIRR